MDEESQFVYLKPLPCYEHEVPYHNFINGKTNVVVDRPPPQVVRDVRGQEKKFTLAANGFEFRQHTLPVVDWQKKSEIEEIYVKDVKNFVQKLVPEKVERCEMFDFRLDQSPLGVLEWLQREFGQEEATEMVNKYRVRVINIWRPLVDVVEDVPLVMCDAQTVKPSDLVHSAHVSDDYVRRNYLVKYNEDFRFYYLSKMTRNEICAFMVFDSSAVGEDSIRKAVPLCSQSIYISSDLTFCIGVGTPPHAAFRHTKHWSSDTQSTCRESIEVRLLVLSALSLTESPTAAN
ncbi:hypothetical protein DL771_001617 [Monosporascus sp. 5C6A]|nr:hypothetical protein DL771_001617 [Monosporascus sp. 5C6A]